MQLHAWVLDFLSDGLLQKLVKLPHFGFDLGDVVEFDFNQGAELGQAELFALVGAEFDGQGGVIAGSKNQRPGNCTFLEKCTH